MTKTKIMGVVNATPDSFSDGGQFSNPAAGIEHALKLAADGADILDIGGESTRPGAETVSIAEEIDRVAPIVEGVKARLETSISVDTRKPAVAEAAFAVGASIWNDVSALTFDDSSLACAAALGGSVVLMHAQGDPKTMQDNPSYDDVVEDVLAFLATRIDAAVEAGIARERLFIDPGIGFGKTLDHNVALFRALNRFSTLAPVLLGASRKRFIAALDCDGPATERIGGSLAAALWGAAAGAAIVRVHDVAETRQALAVWNAIGSADHNGQGTLIN